LSALGIGHGQLDRFVISNASAANSCASIKGLNGCFRRLLGVLGGVVAF